MKNDILPLTKVLGVLDLLAAILIFAISWLTSISGIGEWRSMQNAHNQTLLVGILFIIRAVLTFMQLRIAWILHILFSWITAFIIGMIIMFMLSSLFSSFGLYGGAVNWLFENGTTWIFTGIITIGLIYFFLRPSIRDNFKG